MKTIKRIFAIFMCIVLTLTAAPLSGFVGLDLPNLFDFKAEAATYSGTCGDNLTWSLDTSTGVLNISGTGDMTNFLLSEGGYAYSVNTPWFSYRSYIKNIKFGNGITSIGNYAFAGCYSLTSITIPAGITTIGKGMLYNCTKLTNITVDVKNTYYSSDSYGVLFDKNKTKLIQYPAANSRTSYIIPDNVTVIGDWAFRSCYSLTSVTISDTVTSIGDWAFAYCSSLKDVYYTGIQAQWNKISISSNNEDLTSATIHYNYVKPSSFIYTQTHMVSNYADNNNDYAAKYFGGAAQPMDGSNGTPDMCIPGLNLGENMVPQGIAYYEAKNWLLISSYYKDADTDSYPCYIFALDFSTGKMVAEYKLKEAESSTLHGHVGGIAVSDHNLYITMEGSAIGYAPLSELDKMNGEIIIKESKWMDEYMGTAPISYLSINYGMLITGNFFYKYEEKYNKPAKAANSVILAQNLSGNSSEEEWKNFCNSGPFAVVKVPDSVDRIQGVAYRDEKFYISSSLGRKNTSKFYIADVDKSNGYTLKNIVKYPALPMMEGLTFIGDYIYTLFESASAFYLKGLDKDKDRGVSTNPTDVVWKIDYKELIGVDDTQTVIGDVENQYVEYKNGDKTGFTYLDFKQNWFTEDSGIYNHSLGRLCSQFVMLGYDKAVEDKNKVTLHEYTKPNLKTALEKIGMSDIEIDGYTAEDEVNTFIAHRKIDVNNEEYTLVFAGFIGSQDGQWYNNFDPGTGTTHQGFSSAKKHAYGLLEAYIQRYGFDKSKTKILLTGHSRGAATANLVAAQLIKDKKYATVGNIYTYAFATPNSTSLDERNDLVYKRIFNIVNPEDFVTKVLPTAWGFGRYGTTYVLPSKTNTSFSQYKVYKSNMQQYFGPFTDGQTYEPYLDGESSTYIAVRSLTKSVKNLNQFYKLPLMAGITPVTAHFFFQNSLCHVVSHIANAAEWATAVTLVVETLLDPYSSSAYRDILEYFILYSLSTKDIMISGLFEDAHRAETYCAYMMSMSETQIKQERKGFLNTVNCPVDVEITDKATGEVVGKIVNNVVDEEIAAKENALVMNVDGDSKSFWLPLDGDYEVKLTGNDEGTMDYTVAEIDPDLGETERINFFDVEIAKGKEFTGDVPDYDFVLDEYTLQSDSGLETPDQQLDTESGTVTITTVADGNGYISESVSVKSGDYVTVKAEPGTATAFIEWVDADGKTVSTDANYSFVAKENVTLKAVFVSRAASADGTCGDNLTWTLYKDGELAITGTGAMEEYTDLSSIPWNSYSDDVKKITIGSGVTSVSSVAFAVCLNLTSITVDSNNEYYSNDAVGVLFNKDKSVLFKYPAGNQKIVYSIPDTVSVIAEYAFSFAKHLGTVGIPVSVTDIYDYAFKNTLRLSGIAYAGSKSQWENINVSECSDIYAGDLHFDTKFGLITVELNYEGPFSTPQTLPLYVEIPNTEPPEESYEELNKDDFVSSFKEILIYLYGFNEGDFLIDPDSVVMVDSNGVEIPLPVTVKIDEYFSYYFKCTVKSTKSETLTGKCGDNLTWTLYTLTGLMEIVGSGEMYDYGYEDAPWFKYREYLETVFFDDRVIYIGDHSFYYCYNLKNVKLPSALTTIGDRAFCGCTKLVGVVLPENVENIGYVAFGECQALRSISLSDSLNSLGYAAFGDCINLSEIILPDKVIDFGEDVFKGTAYYNNQSNWESDGGLYIGKHLMCVDTAAAGSYQIKEGTITIAHHTFDSCAGLTEVVIPESVKTIGAYAFAYCTELKIAAIPDGVTLIGNNAFAVCKNLEKITIPDSVTTIGDSAFRNCKKITTVTITENVTEIGSSLFAGCTSLTEIIVDKSNKNYVSDEYGVLFNKDKSVLIQYPVGNTRKSYVIPYGVTSVGAYSFDGCSYITSITIPSTVLEIDIGAFSDCDNIRDIYFNGTEEDLFDLCPWEGNDDLLDANIHPFDEEEFTTEEDSTLEEDWSGSETTTRVPETTTKKPGGEMGDSSTTTRPTTTLTPTTIVPPTTRPNNPAKVNITVTCQKLDSTVDVRTFTYQAKSGTVLTVTDVLAAIKGRLDDEGNYLYDQEIYDIADSVIYASDYGPVILDSLQVIEGEEYTFYVTVKEKSPYIASGTCGENLTWTLDTNGELVISGEGEMEDYSEYYSSSGDSAPAPWSGYRYDTVTIEDGVTTIGDYAFIYSWELMSVSIPNSVTAIGDCVFYSCYYLNDITIGNSIKTIGYRAFGDCVRLGYIDLPSTVTTIDEQAFSSCINLKTIRIPDGVTAIADYTFDECDSLTGVTFGENSKLTTIGMGAFYDCYNIESIELPDSVTTIGSSAFRYCSSLTDITIPDGVTVIGDYTFYECDSLTSITIPENVTEISSGAFGYCNALETIETDSANENYCSIDGVLFSKDKSTLVCYPAGKTVAEYTIPDYVTAIGDYAFAGNLNIETLNIPESVTSIGEFAFSGCDNLKLTTISAGLAEIGDYAFYGCGSLTEVVIPEGITRIGECAFAWCENLTSVKIADSVNLIDDSAFYYCTSLTNVDLGQGVQTIYDDAFAGCYKLESIVIPNSVEYVCARAFAWCNSLKNIIIPEGVKQIGYDVFYYCSALETVDLPASLDVIGDDAFSMCESLESIIVDEGNEYFSSVDGVLFTEDMSTLISYPASKYDKEYTIPETVTTICSYAFSVNKNIKRITIPATVTSIGNYAFAYSALQNVTFAEGVTEIPQYSFYGSDSLVNVTLPSTVTAIGYNAFGDCYELENVYYYGTEESKAEIAIDWNYWLDEAYWHYIQGAADYEFVDGELIISGTGAVTTKVSKLDFADEIKKITIKNDVSGIMDMVFADLPNVTEVVICETVDYIGDFAFENCPKLKTVQLNVSTGEFEKVDGMISAYWGDRLQSIGIMAFAGCTSLESIVIPSTVKTVGNYAFADCTALSSVTLKNGIENIGCAAFSNCIALAEITIPESLKNLGYDAFYGCVALETVYYNAVDCFIDGASSDTDKVIFGERDSIKNFIFGENVKKIPHHLLMNNTGIKEIRIPASVTNIGYRAFSGCTNLERIIVDEGNSYYMSDEYGVLYEVYNNWLDYSYYLIQFPSGSDITRYPILENTDGLYGYAFNPCKVVTLGLPKSVDEIGCFMFEEDSTLKYIYYGGSESDLNKIAWLVDTSISGSDSRDMLDATIFYNSALDDGILESGAFGEDFSWSLYENGELIISGSGKMSDFAPLSQPWYDNINLITKVTLEDGITSVGSNAFYCCKKLTELVMPETLTEIGYSAFGVCSSLESVVIPENVKSISGNAFAYCEKLKEVTLPDSLVLVAAYAFYNCNSLADVYYTGTEELWNKIAIGEENTDLTEATIHYEHTSVIASGNCGDNLTWTLYKDGELVISGTGFMDMEWVSPSDAPWYSYSNDIKTVNIGNGVKFISCYAFYGCDNLTSVTIGNAVMEIGQNAFAFCDNLKSVTIPDSVMFISYNAFYGCDSLASITIPYSVISVSTEQFCNCENLTNITVDDNNQYYSSENGILFSKDKSTLLCYPGGKTAKEYTLPDYVTDIGEQAFSGNAYIETLNIPESVTTIDDQAFYGCDSLTSITIPDSVTVNGKFAFADCDSLISVTIGNGITSIGSCAFYDCDSLISITIPDNVTTIGDSVFAYCDSLTSVTIPDSVTAIGEAAFNYCNSLTDVHYNGTEEQWNEIAIGEFNELLTEATIHFKEPQTYTVAFDSNGGVNVPETQNKTHGEELVISSEIPAKGYMVHYDANGGSGMLSDKKVSCAFIGWNTLADGTGETYLPGTLYSEDSDITLYAQWKNPKVGSMPVPMRSGYVFDGWFTATEGGTQVKASDELSGDITVYAHWSKEVYEISNCKISIRRPDVKTVSYGETLVFEAVVNDLPDGAKIVWSVSGDGSAVKSVSDNGMICTVKATGTGEVTVTANVVNADGVPLKNANGNSIQSKKSFTVKAGIWEIIMWIIKTMFGIELTYLPETLL